MDGKPWFKPTLKVRCGETSLVAEVIFVLEREGDIKVKIPTPSTALRAGSLAKCARRVGTRRKFVDPDRFEIGCNMNHPMSQAARPLTDDPSSPVPHGIPSLAALPEVQSALRWFRDQEAEFARWQMELARIPAPPFGESARAAWLGEQFRALGIKEVGKDKIGNRSRCDDSGFDDR